MSRFDPTNEELRRSLEWHAEITEDLQRRILAVRERVVAGNLDQHVLLALLGPEPPA